MQESSDDEKDLENEERELAKQLAGESDDEPLE